METLYEAVKKQAAKKHLRFHMPGHKGKDLIGLESVHEIDFTELAGLDNLHFPNGCIAEAERLLAELCGARGAFFIVNGSSAGIIASVMAFTSSERGIVCGRNSHVSLFKGLCLSGARPAFVTPEIITEYGICGGIDASRLEEALKREENVGAVFITSPTFEGVTSDISEIAGITHRYGAKLIVDEAHGAHFKFGNIFPETAIEQGADVSIQSWHKTLTAFGQGAVLLFGENVSAEEAERIGFRLSLMQTTSPSYAIMASIDGTRELLLRKGAELFGEYEKNLRLLRGELSELRGMRLLSRDIIGRHGVCGLDEGKLTICVEGGGKALDAHLRSMNIYAEMSAFGHIVLMTSFADSRNDYEALLSAVAAFDTGSLKLSNNAAFPRIEYKTPDMAYTPSESMDRGAKTIAAKDAAGKISAGFITPYPPGIPLVAPGEVISREIAELCGYYKVIDINGVIEGGFVKILE